LFLARIRDDKTKQNGLATDYRLQAFGFVSDFELRTSVCGVRGLRGHELPRLLFDEGDVLGHVFLELGRVVLEINGDERTVAEGVDFLEAVRAVGRAFADDGVTAVERGAEKLAATAAAAVREIKVRRFMWFEYGFIIMSGFRVGFGSNLQRFSLAVGVTLHRSTLVRRELHQSVPVLEQPEAEACWLHVMAVTQVSGPVVNTAQPSPV